MSVSNKACQTTTRRLIPLAFTLLMAGCATTECDPGQGGFARGIGCLASDSYGQRQQQKQQEVTQERQKGQDLQTAYNQTRAQQQQVQRQRAAAEADYAGLQRELSQMRKQLASAKGQNRELEQRIVELESETQFLEQDTFTPESAKQERLAILRERKQVLEGEVDQVLSR